jgi:hypothetical protein
VTLSNRKRWLRAWRWVGIAAALLAGFTLFGWRYGFSPLPVPDSGSAFVPEPPLARVAYAPDNCWFWLRELERRLRVDPQARASEEVFFSTVDAWARSGTQPSPGADGLVRWLRDNAEIDRCFRGFLGATNTLAPASFMVGEVRAGYVFTTHALLRAAERERRGETAAAFAGLIEAWRFQARLTPPATFVSFYDERGVEQVNQTLARPWRRLAINGPALSPVIVHRLLEDLAAVTNSVPGLDRAYAQAVSAAISRAHEPSITEWRRVRLAFRQAVMTMSSDMLRLVQAVWGRLVDTRTDVAPIEGARRLGRPVGMLVAAWQRAIARPDDFTQMHSAWLSRTLGALKRGEPAPRLSRGWFRRWFDRPAVWNSLELLPEAEPLRTTQRQWLVYLESCRLSLALRAFREAHGRWPNRLEELVPEWLPAVPADPFGGRPFGYRRDDTGWQLWSVGPAGHAPSPEEAGALPQRVFRGDGT